ncbi:group II intron reverse transcriptase/maturase, partial [Streptomyces sp. ISL-100]|uniref:group II intron reverse transcriptase/maturase n=1 Tax=Streptomyces sp. ISL-100 TaxID=2819173 RepID=UPI0027E4D190
MLKLELSESKTLIKHAATQPARFLGYNVRAQRSDTRISRGRRATNGVIGLFVPPSVIRQRCAINMRGGKPARRGMLIHDSDYSIVVKYQAEYRGLVQYYLLAQDVHRLGCLRWAMEASMRRCHVVG